MPISIAPNNKYNPTTVSDGAGGAIVTWEDFRGGDSDIYAQRVNAAGVPQWTANGVALCTAANQQYFPVIVSDGAGGVIITWQDARGGINWDVYAQRVNAAGVPQWTVNGVALSTAANDQAGPMIVSDDEGGAIITWQDFRLGYNVIYAQRVNAAGVPQWTANGAAVTTLGLGDGEYSPSIAPDGAGGAIIAWSDLRTSQDHDIYAQRVNAAGVPQWAASGVPLCVAPGFQKFPTIASDGAGGAIVTWYDGRLQMNVDIYAQRVSAAGVPLWTVNGVLLCTANSTQINPMIVSDGAGGAIVTWDDTRVGDYDVYAQRVSAAGVPQWIANGVPLCSAIGSQSYSRIASDGAGGAIVTWYDHRSGTSFDIYAQRVNPAGVPQWRVDGVALCTAVNNQYNPTVASDGSGGAIVPWMDFRSGTRYDIYAQNINSDGTLGNGPVPTLASLVSVDAFADFVSLRWYDPNHSLATIKRANDEGNWQPIATVSSAGSGSGLYEDHSVVAGQRYGYRLNIRVGEVDELVGETWVTVPAEASFALRNALPNPSVGPLRVSFSLLDSAPATIEIFDLSGRRLESLSVGSLGPGSHVTSLSPPAGGLRPGVYSVCLTQGSRRAFTKIAIVR